MNTITRFQRVLRGVPQRAARFTPGLALLAGLALLGPTSAALAQGGFSGGDSDTVGSLPIVGSDDPVAGSHVLDAGAPDDAGTDVRWSDHWRTRVIGAESVLQRLFLGASGRGYVLREELDGLGTVAYTFVGDVRVSLDRELLKQSFVTVEMAIGPVFTGGRSVVHAGGRQAAQVLHVGNFDLHLRQLAKSGLTDAGVQVEGWSRQRLQQGGNAHLEVRALRGSIVLTQKPTPGAR